MAILLPVFLTWTIALAISAIPASDDSTLVASIGSHCRPAILKDA